MFEFLKKNIPYRLIGSINFYQRKEIKDLMAYGLRGIEAYHRKHSPAIVEYFSSMAENLGLIVTGGSDFHAPNIMNGQIILGKNFVPEWIYDQMINEKRCLDMA